MRVSLRGAIWVTSLLLVLVAADTTMLRAASSPRSYAIDPHEEGEAAPQSAQQTVELFIPQYSEEPQGTLDKRNVR